jgi:ribose transport system substrate-binding protein
MTSLQVKGNSMKVGRKAVAACSVALAMSLVGTIVASHASGGSATATKKIVMVIPIPCAAGPYFTAICNAATAEAKKTKGITFELKTLTTPDNNAYINLLQTTEAAEHPDGYILMPTSATALLPALRKVSSAGAKISFIDSTVPGLKSATTFIGTDNVTAGRQAAQWLIQNASLAKSREVGMVENAPGITSTDDRAAGFKAALKGSGFKVVAQAASTNPCDTNFARTSVQNFLTAHPNIGAIFNVCDPFALGAVQALQAAGKRDVLNVGVDGIPANVKGIASNKSYNADVAQNPALIGVAGVKYMALALSGQSVPKRIDTGTQVVTKQNAKFYLSHNGY